MPVKDGIGRTFTLSRHTGENQCQAGAWLAPVIEDDIFIAQVDVRRKKVPDGPHNTWWREITLGIIVATHNKNAGMMAVDLHNQVVQIQEIAVIAGEQSTIVLGGMRKMDCVILSQQTDVPWHLHVVPRLAK
jgi:hypothetical protein